MEKEAIKEKKVIDYELLDDALFFSKQLRKEVKSWKEVGISGKAIAIAILFWDIVLREAKVLSDDERKAYIRYFKKLLKVDKV